MDIKDRIRALRKAKNLSQGELGQLVNISLKTISTIETGKSDLSTEQVKVLSNFFGVSTDYLLTGQEGTSEISPEEREVIKMFREDTQVREAFKTAIAFKKKALNCLTNHNHSSETRKIAF